MQSESLNGVVKATKTAQEKLAAYQKRNLCRDFTAGRCKRAGTCKFAHVLPATAPAMASMNAEASQPGERNDPTSGFGAVAGAQGNQNQSQYCVHYERGYCRYLNNCNKIHDSARYGSRPRSNSAGQQGFQKPPRATAGDLGVVMEETSQLPEIPEPQKTPAVAKEEMKMLDEMAKGATSQTEKAMINQIRELRVNAILNPESFASMLAAVKSSVKSKTGSDF